MDQLKGIQIDTPLSQAFFSRQNIHSLQVNIRHQVWLKSHKKHVIGYQDQNELLIVMRSVYLQYSLNQPTNILQQIKDLNEMVLKYCVENVLSQLKQYISYNDHINQDLKIMEHSVNTSIRGNKQLEMKPWI